MILFITIMLQFTNESLAWIDGSPVLQRHGFMENHTVLPLHVTCLALMKDSLFGKTSCREKIYIGFDHWKFVSGDLTPDDATDDQCIALINVGPMQHYFVRVGCNTSYTSGYLCDKPFSGDSNEAGELRLQRIHCLNNWTMIGELCYRHITNTNDAVTLSLTLSECNTPYTNFNYNIHKHSAGALLNYLRKWQLREAGHSVVFVLMVNGQCVLYTLSDRGMVMKVAYEVVSCPIAYDAGYDVLCVDAPRAHNRSHPERYFACDDDMLILSIYVCDTITDCPFGEDEMNCSIPCEYNNTKELTLIECLHFCLPPNCTCAVLFFQCYIGGCVPMHKICDEFSDCRDGSDEEFCPTNQLIESYSTRNILSGREERSNCSNPFHTTCHKGVYDICYAKRDICVYDRDDAGGVSFCPDGSHLEGCTEHECPNEFKCPKSYCVPLYRVCDGVRDCPRGDDEIRCEDRSCPGLFRCRFSGQCLHPYNLCDKQTQCTGGSSEDEELCDSLPCPDGCVCLGYAYSCTGRFLPIPKISSRAKVLILKGNAIQFGITNDLFFFFRNLIILDISKNNIHLIPPEMFLFCSKMITLNLSHNNLQKLNSYTFSGLLNLVNLNLAHNNILLLERYSFFGLESLKLLTLSHQGLTTIEDLAFHGLTSLTSLDLSHNSLQIITRRMLMALVNLERLYIQNNQLRLYDSGTFQVLQNLKRLAVDFPELCCFVPDDVKCTPQVSVMSSCTSLVSGRILGVIIWPMLCLVLGLNLVSIYWWARRSLDKRNLYALLVIGLSVSDSVMGLYLIAIGYYQEKYRGVYGYYDREWRSSWVCSALGFFSFMSFEMSLGVMLVMSVQRYVGIVLSLKRTNIPPKAIVSILTALSLVNISLSIIPMWFSSFDTANNSLCLLVVADTPKPMSIYSFCIFVVYNLMLCISLLTINVFIIRELLSGSGKPLGETASNDRTRKIHRAVRRSILAVSTNIVVWITITLLHIVAISGVSIGIRPYSWLMLIIMSTNSILNPVLHTITTREFFKRAQKNIKPVINHHRKVNY